MAYARKTWAEKMRPGMQPEIKHTTEEFADVPKGAKMLIATPEIIEQYIRNIPRGTQSNLRQMRKDLAAEYGTEYTCPITSGMFLRIVAENAYEQYKKGVPVNKIAPFWRMIDKKTPTAMKLTFSVAFINQQRKNEGLPV